MRPCPYGLLMDSSHCFHYPCIHNHGIVVVISVTSEFPFRWMFLILIGIAGCNYAFSTLTTHSTN